jgi:hypothetical protein
MIYRGYSFFAVVGFGSCPTLSSRQQVVSLFQWPVCRRSTDGGGGGRGAEGLFFYNHSILSGFSPIL